MTPSHPHAEADGLLGLSSSGTQRNKLRREPDEYETAYDGDSMRARGHRHTDSGVSINETSPKEGNTKTAYWGDLSKEGRGANTRDLPERSRFDEDFTESTGRAQPRDSHLGNAAAYAGGVPRKNHEDTTSGLPDSSRLSGEEGRLIGRHHGGKHDLRQGDSEASGGVYNSVTGAGSPEFGHTNTRGSHAGGVVHDPLTSSASGIPVSSTSGNNTYNYKTDLRGEGAPTSRNDHTGLGLTGAAVGAGAAAGYGAHELGRRGHEDRALDGAVQRNSAYGSNQGDGVPRSSMLDPDPNVARSTSKAGYSNTTPPAAGFSGGSPSHSNASAGSGAFSSPTSGGIGGAARSHYGPGHEGSKVLHTCQHCGQDNDISKYFSKDVVYRLGS